MSPPSHGIDLGANGLMAPQEDPEVEKYGAASLIACASLACAMAAASLAAAPGGAGLFGAALAVLMIAIAVVDAHRFIIPDRVSLAAFLLGLAEAARQSQSFEAAPASIAVAALRGVVLALIFLGFREIYLRLRQRQGIGLGDVKLAAVAGVWLDWTLIPVAIEIAALTALTIYGARQLVMRRPLRATAKLPFGLFFAPAIWLCWLLEAMLLKV
jgi:leader peptidase (prepilin peptidase)/N-methyltransferase